METDWSRNITNMLKTIKTQNHMDKIMAHAILGRGPIRADGIICYQWQTHQWPIRAAEGSICATGINESSPFWEAGADQNHLIYLWQRWKENFISIIFYRMKLFCQEQSFPVQQARFTNTVRTSWITGASKDGQKIMYSNIVFGLRCTV